MSEEISIIYKGQFERIDGVLKKLLRDSEAKCSLLVDKDGHLIAKQGFTHSLDTTSLAALLAGSFASTKEMAKILGEPEFSVLFHEGRKDNIHVSLVGKRSILGVVFDDRTTIGMVRLYVREAEGELKEILEDHSECEEGIGRGFADQAKERLDQIFGD